jgi:hypothetical protein
VHLYKYHHRSLHNIPLLETRQRRHPNRNPRCQTIQVQVDITKDLITAVPPVEETTDHPLHMEEEGLEDIRKPKLPANRGRPRVADPTWCDPGWEL